MSLTQAGARRRLRPQRWRLRAARAPAAQQQQAAGREAVRPERGGTLTQSIGSLPSLTGFAQIVGLALGAPEFQRR
jgi:hypothetical protein